MRMAVPSDVIFQILEKLPFKSVVRFRCLSKLYASSGSNQLFVKAHAIRFPITPIALLVTCSAPLQSAQMFFSVDYNGGQVVSLLTVPDGFSRYSTHSVKGWVCMDFGIQAKVCNPSTRQVTTLPFVCQPTSPKASSTYHCVNSIGFDPIKMQFKVLNSWAVPGQKTEYRVFTLGIDTEWRLLHGGPCYLPQRESVCIDGVVYFRSWIYDDYQFKGAVLVAFDVGSESFSVITLPQGTPLVPQRAPLDGRNSDLIQYKGKPAIVDYTLADDDFVRFWELNDSRTENWVMYTRFWPLISERGLEGDQMYFVAGTLGKDDQLLVAPRSRRFWSSLSVIHWDPDRNYTSEFLIEGLPPCPLNDFSSDTVRFTCYEESILSFS